MPLADARDRLGPELSIDGRRPVARPRPVAPGAGEDLRLEQHRHVATDAVGAVGDATELGDHRLAQPAVPVVELQRIAPAGEVGVAPVGEDLAAVHRLDGGVVLRLATEIVLGPLDEVLRVRVRPGVVERHVVGDEVDQQALPAPTEALAQAGQRRVAAEVVVDVVGDDGERRPDDVGLAHVGEVDRQIGAHVGRARAALPRRARLPEAQHPDPAKTAGRRAVEQIIRQIVERGGAPSQGRRFIDRDARVDLVQRRKSRVRHGGSRRT